MDSEKSLTEFIALTTKLSPLQFLGLAKILNVDIEFKNDESKAESKADNTDAINGDCANTMENADGADKPEKKPRQHVKNFEDLFSDLIDNFVALNRKSRREIMNVLRDQVRRNGHYGADTKHTTES